MEPASLAFGVVAIFKDTYLTAKFIRNTIRTIKGYYGEQSQMTTHFTVQIYRLKNLSRLFRANDGNKVDMTLLETVPEEYLNTVRDVLLQLQQVLAEYAKLAVTLDEDYKRFSPLSPLFTIDPVNDSFEIDDSVSTEELEPPKQVGATKTTGLSSSHTKWWLFRPFAWGGSKTLKVTRTSKISKSLISLRNLPPGVEWVFTRNELEKTLKKFETWNNDLEHLIAPLLDGFGFYRNKDLQKRLRPDGEVNIFQGHLDLNKLAISPNIGLKDTENTLIPWELLAQLLRTAGKHSFHTLPFNSYACDATNAQYAFLFDYPAGTSTHKPKSLNDFILSGEDGSGFKLELKQRFHVAQTLARAIGAFHSDGWLHKNIRAHAVKFFFHENTKRCDFENPYLTDFEFSRPVAGVTRLAPHAIDTEHEVYRHPDRQGLPNASFSKIHDIYSMGVVLLEIGLWQTAKQIFDDIVKYDLDGVVPAANVMAQRLRGAYLDDARKRLAHRMGAEYQQAVLACLEGEWHDLIGRRDFANEFQKRVVQKVDIKVFIT
ncbi:hypothetical protein FPCIR_13873 [Fusarium pseudocircinatum]|uniref:Protein kinase domain-containing protein n=1 Tax=Fusarium pseudocircinatum TaxID=56676 RepID=A0A8H5NPY8_9HYPO|nr:hypothetical protein FPCIR_13873 [Fusarium pseudocircinatum]